MAAARVPARPEHFVPICLGGQGILPDQASFEKSIDNHCRLVVDRAVETDRVGIGVELQIEGPPLVLARQLEDLHSCDLQISELTVAARSDRYSLARTTYLRSHTCRRKSRQKTTPLYMVNHPHLLSPKISFVFEPLFRISVFEFRIYDTEVFA
jgi:hypothetical protein